MYEPHPVDSEAHLWLSMHEFYLPEYVYDAYPLDSDAHLWLSLQEAYLAEYIYDAHPSHADSNLWMRLEEAFLSNIPYVVTQAVNIPVRVSGLKGKRSPPKFQNHNELPWNWYDYTTPNSPKKRKSSFDAYE